MRGSPNQLFYALRALQARVFLPERAGFLRLRARVRFNGASIATMQQVFPALGYMAAIITFVLVVVIIARRFEWDSKLNRWFHPFNQFWWCRK